MLSLVDIDMNHNELGILQLRRVVPQVEFVDLFLVEALDPTAPPAFPTAAGLLRPRHRLGIRLRLRLLRPYAHRPVGRTAQQLARIALGLRAEAHAVHGARVEAAVLGRPWRGVRCLPTTRALRALSRYA